MPTSIRIERHGQMELVASQQRPHGPMARRLTTNQEIAGSSPAVVNCMAPERVHHLFEGFAWCFLPIITCATTVIRVSDVPGCVDPFLIQRTLKGHRRYPFILMCILVPKVSSMCMCRRPER